MAPSLSSKQKALIAVCLLILLSLIGLYGIHIKNDSNRPMFSVIMIAYNRAALISDAIESVLAQTYPDFELIIVDDGSTDNTVAIAKKYQRKDNRIVIVKNKRNKGIPYTRNRGNKIARGKYITVLDSDDEMMPELLKKTLHVFEQNPSATVVYPHHIYQLKDTGQIQEDVIYPLIYLFSANIIQNSGVSFKRAFIEKNNISYNEAFKLAEDYEFWMQMISKDARFISIPETLVLFKIHKKSSDYQKKMSEAKDRVINKLCRHFGISFEKRKDICYIANHLQRQRQVFLTAQELRKAIRSFCIPPDKPIRTVKHTNWEGPIVFENESRAYRIGVWDQEATIVEYTQDSFTLKWDKWGEETFQKKGNDLWYYVELKDKK